MAALLTLPARVWGQSAGLAHLSPVAGGRIGCAAPRSPELPAAPVPAQPPRPHRPSAGSRARARHFRHASARPRRHRESPPRLTREPRARSAAPPSAFGTFRHHQTLPIGPGSASMGAAFPRARSGDGAHGVGAGAARLLRRRERGGGARVRELGGGEVCGVRLFRPGHGASPPPRHGSPCPCSSPLSERKWPPPPSQRPQPPPPPQQQHGRHLGEAGVESAPRQETGRAKPGNAGQEAG